MSEESGPLNFDRAEPLEPAAAALACSSCKQPIAESYYRLQNQSLCPACHEAVAWELTGGSGGARFTKAFVLGTIAAVVGAGIYFAVLALTGYEIGLIAILVGLLVGGAVRKGSEGRGGWVYQALAVFLTYTAIAATYLTYAIKDMPRTPEKASADKVAVQHVKEPPHDGASPAPESPREPRVPVVVAIVMVIALAYALPVIVGTQSILSLVIIGFALFEAWKINKRAPLAITGPFRLQAAPPGAPPGV